MIIHIGDEGMHDPYKITNLILILNGKMIDPFLYIIIKYFLIKFSF